ncbi:type 2 isopentenyl-diphosphate Delta-isomerase [Aestuariivirga sp.]|jgi:isopentenyl-diphosphate delta-isomerase|uniref:type 2 isopentenyl-diphosphate Delta-isomerase n=1 Tax=Aestuariivirga sp. TaxID=2650926 RepID=UPI00378411D5
MSDIGQRKREHIDIVLSGSARHSAPAGFDAVHFQHNALPEADLGSIDLSTSFLGRKLRLPYLASSMTGGPDVAERINRAIAEAAQQLGFAMAVGSQRISLTTADRSGLGPELRRLAPDVPIYGNLGAVQLVHGMGLAEARRAVDELGADALILHLNPLQEALQQGGDWNWTGVEPAISALTRALPVPVIVKEVGSGISAAVARRLADCGVAAIDVAGAGGTSWAAVEGRRSASPAAEDLGDIFRDWGIPTARCLSDVHAALPLMPLIASGGIRHGLDAAKAIRLGATLTGQAAALLPAAMNGPEAVIAHVGAVARALRIACFATGSRNLAALRTAQLQ